jgi:cardiolipin synthase A/B
LDSEHYLRMVSTLCGANAFHHSTVQTLTNGEVFYEAELSAIRTARRSITLEAYIFQKGKIAKRFVDALAERARSGVKVNLVLDAIGSFATWNSYFADLTAAGGRVCWYHGFRWHTLPRLNHRTHRELLIIDGEVAFLGGAGIADHWFYGSTRNPPWRDTMFRVEGEAVAGLQGSFVENWLEASGELLTEDDYLCFAERPSERPVLVVNSSPSTGSSTRGRILFQTLMASATRSLQITTPYFLPDRGVRAELIHALERGVRVRIVAPGKKSDHLLTRRSSRRLYGDLLKAGAEIYEYQPSMIHTKSMIVDGAWCIVGSSNFDHRSFSINDEVNLATYDPRLASRLNQDFVCDVAASHLVTYQEWRRRPLYERFHEVWGRLLERQQ